ncbi:hypothetical protein ACC706_36675, partial [Rhizobium johnstonii]
FRVGRQRQRRKKECQDVDGRAHDKRRPPAEDRCGTAEHHAEPKRTGPRPSLDWAGALTITPGLLLFVFGITNAAAAGWQAFATWGSLV